MKNCRILWAMVSIALALLLWAPVSGEVQAAEVKFLDLSDFTGPVAGLALPGSLGTEDYIKDINAKGGIDGVTIKYIGVDTRYDVARGLSAFKRYRRDRSVVAGTIVSTPLGKILGRLTRREKRVFFTPGDGEYQAHPGNFFLYGAPYQDAFSATIDWILKDWEEKGKTGSPKVGVMSWDNPYGREMLRGGKEYAESKGVTILPSELFPPGSLKHDVYLTRLKNAGANYIYVGGVDPTQTNVMRDASAMGLTRRIQFISDYWGPSTLGVSLHPEALEEMVVVSFFLRGAEAQNHPLVKRLWTTYRNKSPQEMNEGYCIGVLHGMHLEAALRDAIHRVGPNKLTKEVVYESFLSLSGLDRQGVGGPSNYGPKSRRGSKMLKFYKVTDGKIVPITDWVEAPDSVSLHQW